MCGRFIQISGPEKIRASLGDLEVSQDIQTGLPPRYNISPTQDILAVLNMPRPLLTATRWGLIPFWAKDTSIGNRMINARAETLLEKPSFRTPLRKRRCIIFSEGFYEWKGTGKDKEPFFIRMKGSEPFGFAGLWDTWADKTSGAQVISSTIITTDANTLVAPIHSRMPVILSPGDYGTWLSAGTVPDDALADLLRPCDPGQMEAYRISRYVNNPRNDSPECMKPI